MTLEVAGWEAGLDLEGTRGKKIYFMNFSKN